MAQLAREEPLYILNTKFAGEWEETSQHEFKEKTDGKLHTAVSAFEEAKKLSMARLQGKWQFVVVNNNAGDDEG